MTIQMREKQRGTKRGRGRGGNNNKSVNESVDYLREEEEERTSTCLIAMVR